MLFVKIIMLKSVLVETKACRSWRVFTRATYAMCKRGLCCRPASVRLFVRPSGTSVNCIHIAEDIVKLLVALIPNSKGTRSAGRKIHGGVKMRLKLSFFSETVRDRPMVTMEH